MSENVPANLVEVMQGTLNTNLADPQGTLEELAVVGMKPDSVGSCAPHSRKVKGCSYYEQCRFTPWRDRQDGRAGPLNIGVRRTLPPEQGGHMNEFAAPCFNWYASGLRAEQMDTPTSGVLVQIVAYEGDGKDIRERCSMRDPDGGPDSRKVKKYVDSHPVPKFLRPTEKFAPQRMAQEGRQETIDEVERDALRAALSKQGVTATREKEPRGKADAK